MTPVNAAPFDEPGERIVQSFARGAPLLGGFADRLTSVLPDAGS